MSNNRPYLGLTVAEAASARIREIDRLVKALRDERSMLVLRYNQFRTSKMLYAEYRATKAEPFQTTRLPKPKEDEK